MTDTPPGMSDHDTMLAILDQDEWWRHQTGNKDFDAPSFQWSRRIKLTLEHRASILAYIMRKAPEIVQAHVNHLERVAFTIPGDTDATEWLLDSVYHEMEQLSAMSPDECRRRVVGTEMAKALLSDVAAFMGFVTVRGDRLTQLEDIEQSLRTVQGVR